MREPVPVLSLAHDLWRAFVHPRRAWNSLHRWGLLARHAELPYADVMRYRRELFDDPQFHGHLEAFRALVPYVFPGAAELYVVVRATRPRVIVETGVASGLSSAHILRALAANGTGTLYSIDLPNVQEGSVLPQGRTPGWIVPDSLRGSWRWQMGGAGSPLPELLTALGPGAQ